MDFRISVIVQYCYYSGQNSWTEQLQWSALHGRWRPNNSDLLSPLLSATCPSEQSLAWDSYLASCCRMVRAPTIDTFFKMCTVRLRFSGEHRMSQKGWGSRFQYKVPCLLIHHVHVMVAMKTSIMEVPGWGCLPADVTLMVLCVFYACLYEKTSVL